MAYIVMDMEWNQAMSSHSAVFNKLPIHLRGEVIQIGAVKLDDNFYPAEEFQIDVKPVYFRKMHYKVEKLTGFDKERLENGVSFKLALEKFREFCGDDCVLITWGSDDKPIMEQNIIVHDLDWDWINRWVNLQVIYNVQTQAGRNQTGLSLAMEHFEIEQTRVAHDALGDAYNTALVCSKLDFLEGLKDYDNATTNLSSKRRISNEDSEGDKTLLEHRAFTGYLSREEVFADLNLSAPLCPICGEKMKTPRYVNQGDKRYMTLCTCKKHDSFLVRIKIRETEEETFTANRIIYVADSKMEQFYKEKLKASKVSRRRSRKKIKATKENA